MSQTCRCNCSLKTLRFYSYGLGVVTPSDCPVRPGRSLIEEPTYSVLLPQLHRAFYPAPIDAGTKDTTVLFPSGQVLVSIVVCRTHDGPCHLVATIHLSSTTVFERLTGAYFSLCLVQPSHCVLRNKCPVGGRALDLSKTVISPSLPVRMLLYPAFLSACDVFEAFRLLFSFC